MSKVTRNFDLLTHMIQNCNQSVALAKKANGSWTNYSTDQVNTIIHNLAYGLLNAGIKKGDRIAIISTNRPEWNFADLACSIIGVVTVPMYPTLSVNDYTFILNDAGVKIAFAESADLVAKVNASKEGAPSIQNVYSFDPVPGCDLWSVLLKQGENNPNPEIVKELSDSVMPDDLMTLIYTSGTTGVPKGVMLTHNNILSNVRSVSKIFPHDTRGTKSLSFLPLCHIFERTASYAYMYLGIGIYYAESMETIGDNLKEVCPQYFTTVPRLLEKVYDKIVAKGNDLTGVKKKLFFWALNLGLRYELHGKNGAWYEFQLKIANKLIFSKWREALGGNVQFIFSGAAALQPRLARIFTAGGIIVLEGYGLTETSPVITANRIEENSRMFGTVGTIIDDVQIKIDTSDGAYNEGEGEICCKGPNVMKGYYNRPDLTAEVIDKDGWFHTGDVGRIIDGKFLKITDRKKEVFKTSGGKYVAPQPMENKFKESIYIEQIMVIGENRKFPAALVVPAWEQLRDWANRNMPGTDTSFAALASNPKVISLIDAAIKEGNKDFGNWEQVKKFEIIPGEWTIDGGEVTPTLKLKRKPILQKYNNLVEKIYAE